MSIEGQATDPMWFTASGFHLRAPGARGKMPTHFHYAGDIHMARSEFGGCGAVFGILVLLGIAAFVWRGELGLFQKPAPKEPQQQAARQAQGPPPATDEKPAQAPGTAAEVSPKEVVSEIPMGQPALLGDVIVTVTGTAIERVRVRSSDGESQSPEPLFLIRLEVRNKNQTRQIRYDAWANQTLGFLKPKLSDDAGNQYQERSFAPARVVGQISGVAGTPIVESVSAEKPATDILVFEPPSNTARKLRLELPAQNVGGEGMVAFGIPFTPPPPLSAKEQADKEAREKVETQKMRKQEQEKRAKEEAEGAADEKQKAEAAAKSHLGFTKVLISDGKTDKAKDRLKYVIDKYPNTEAAKEAKKLLDSLKK
jgi:hypothetical protein